MSVIPNEANWAARPPPATTALTIPKSLTDRIRAMITAARKRVIRLDE